jgi:hypothetical protein
MPIRFSNPRCGGMLPSARLVLVTWGRLTIIRAAVQRSYGGRRSSPEMGAAHHGRQDDFAQDPVLPSQRDAEDADIVYVSKRAAQSKRRRRSSTAGL